VTDREVLAFDLYGTLVDPIAISGELDQVLGASGGREVARPATELAKTRLRTVVPTDPPICREVLTSAPAIPASPGLTLIVPPKIAEENRQLTPRPVRMRLGTISPVVAVRAEAREQDLADNGQC
jgi:hypothetical protein